MRRFAIAMVVYAVLAALDLYTTHLALSTWGVERNALVAPLVYSGRYDILALLNLLVYAPFALMLESRNRYVRLFAAVFLAATVALRSYVCVNNVMVYLGRGELPWLR